MADHSFYESVSSEAEFAPLMAEITLMQVYEQLQKLQLHVGVPRGPSVVSSSVSFLLLQVQQPNGIPASYAVQSEQVSSFLLRNPRASAQYVRVGASTMGRSISVQIEPTSRAALNEDYFYDYEPHETQMAHLKDGINEPLINNMSTVLAHELERCVHAGETALQKVARTVACLQQASIVF